MVPDYYSKDQHCNTHAEHLPDQPHGTQSRRCYAIKFIFHRTHCGINIGRRKKRKADPQYYQTKHNISGTGMIMNKNEWNETDNIQRHTKGRNYPTRIPCQFDGKDGQIVLDQIRTVDKIRIIRKLGKINTSTQKEVLTALTELFSE